MNVIITYAEIKNPQYNIVADVINHYYITSGFICALTYLSKRISYGSEYAGFTFWDDLDDYDKQSYDKPFLGVELNYLSDDEAVL